MSRIFASAIMWTAAFVGLLLGFTFTVGVAYLIGLYFNAGLAGALSGLVWWSFSYFYTINDITSKTEEQISKLVNYN